ncbi:hypothetical protein K439DRAFT_1394398 [Ramaria rubella]|nr:hypothetical protein K439DRAFT_1394398 [Ramaria rubella]
MIPCTKIPVLLWLALVIPSAVAINATHLLSKSSSSAFLQALDVARHPEIHFGGGNDQKRDCKVQPTDIAWPTQSHWDALNTTLEGQLVEPSPIAAPCYSGDLYNPQECALITKLWNDSDLHAAHPSSIMSPLYTGLSCLPTSDPIAGNCTQGTYPNFVVNARSVRDVQAVVNFARNANIRLVIKNTGHDFSGKASGKGSLSIRMHMFKDIDFIESYESEGYNGPAFRVGAGVQGRDIYAAAHSKGYAVVAGEGATVGYAGGYIQGGGHSPLSSRLGMGADSALSINLVLANGTYTTASPEINSDLFWALCGGGGSTFGILISVTVRVHEDLPVTISQFSFNASHRDILAAQNGGNSRNDFWEVVKAYFGQFIDNVDRGIYSYWNIGAATDGSGGMTFNMAPYFAPNHSAAEVEWLLQPILNKAKELSIEINPITTSLDNFYDAWKLGFPQEPVGNWNTQPGSRLLPRANFNNATALFNETWQVVKDSCNNGSFIIGFNIAPTLEAGGQPDNSINPAWRGAVAHIITNLGWDISLRDLGEIDRLRLDFTHNKMEYWRRISPGSGCYMNEADINEPNRQQAFWGSNYERLYQLKQKFDPNGVFFAETAVGSEEWTTGLDRLGDLCPVNRS